MKIQHPQHPMTAEAVTILCKPRTGCLAYVIHAQVTETIVRVYYRRVLVLQQEQIAIEHDCLFDAIVDHYTSQR